MRLRTKGLKQTKKILGRCFYGDCERLTQYLMDITKNKALSMINANHQEDEYVHLKNAKIHFSLMDTAPLDGGGIMAWETILC